MWQLIEKERSAAEHLFYVSLKYTKTCDVILNLILRWQGMIELSINALLAKAKKKRLVKVVPIAPRARVNLLLETLKKEKIVTETLQLYLFFKRIPKLEQVKEGEFRKNVALRISDGSKEVVINLEKLKEWQELLEKFLSFVKHFIK
jgi:cell division protein YceG involved in septum cleavage